MRDKKYLELKAFKYLSEKWASGLLEFTVYESISKEIAKIAIEKDLSISDAYAEFCKPVPIFSMTKKANGLPREAFIANGWKNKWLIKSGYMEEIKND